MLSLAGELKHLQICSEWQAYARVQRVDLIGGHLGGSTRTEYRITYTAKQLYISKCIHAYLRIHI